MPFHVRYRVFVQITRADDLRCCEAGFIKHSPRLDAQCNAISRIQPHSDHFVSVFAQPAGYIDRVAHALEGIIGVHQEDAVVRHRFGIRFKRLALTFEEHDPTVRLRSAHWNSEPFAGSQIRRTRAAAYLSRSCRGQTAINALCAAQTKLDDWIIFSGQTYARRFCRDETFEIQNVKQSRFQNLTLDNWTAYPD